MLPLAVPVPDRLAQTVLARMGGPGNELVCPGTLEGVLVSWCPAVESALLWEVSKLDGRSCDFPLYNNENTKRKYGTFHLMSLFGGDYKIIKTLFCRP
jgi:hypothetical protein